MNKLNQTPTSVIVLYSLIISLLIIPVGKSLTPTLFVGIDTSISSLIWYFILLLTPIFLIINFIKTWKTKHLTQWSRIYKRVIFYCIIVFVADKFSAMSQFGYINLAPFDILMRISVMGIFYLWLYDWVKNTYNSEENIEGMRIVKIIAITQIAIFSIATILNLVDLLI